MKQSIGCAEQHVELIFYSLYHKLVKKMAKYGNFIIKRGKDNYNVAQLRIITKGQGDIIGSWVPGKGS